MTQQVIEERSEDGERTAPRARTAPVALPRVNLLPPEIRESTRLRAVQAGIAGAVVVTTGLVGLVAVGVAADTAAARDELVAAQSAGAQVQADVTGLAYVRDVYAQVESTEAAVTAARASEIPWSYLLNELSLTIPHDVWIETVSVSPSAVTPGQAPVNYGTVTYTGRGRSHDDVATWLETLAAQRGLTDATLTTSAQDETGGVPTVTFSSTATVTAEALASGTEG